MLHELQTAFRSAVLQGTPDAACATIVSDRVPAVRRLAVHRHNLLASLIEALRAAFPVTARRLAEERFAVLAQAFVEASPPRQPQLLAYGESFPTFLSATAWADVDPSLPDLARLEWARVEACFAAETPHLSPGRLAAIAPGRSGDIVFRLHPSVRLVASAHPLLALWGEGSAMGEAAAAGAVLVLRSSGAVEMAPLAAGDFALLRMVRTGMPLDVAAAAGEAADPGFDLQAALAAHLSRGTFCGFSFHPTRKRNS
ncbi:MAG: HvfC/BufC family peptide modification chaperone [Inquilinus sp.]|uniref:HvfC/BufC family peptide modification chaperone n=1 Tax=Inquilinus sp. TaxID=1932117 RepID=UPI003F2BB85F